MVKTKYSSSKTKRTDKTDILIERITEGKFVCLKDKYGTVLNVAYTEQGLHWTTDKNGRYIWGQKGLTVEPFIPRKEVLYSRSHKARMEKLACNKANAMMYEQR